jgi:hypothetical protein
MLIREFRVTWGIFANLNNIFETLHNSLPESGLISYGRIRGYKKFSIGIF